MADPHVLTGLVAKRSEIAGQIEHVQTTLRQLIIDLDNLDATIRIFRPDIDLEEIRPKPFPPRHAAFKGEIMRVVMATLRTAGKPLTCPEITLQVMAERGLNTADPRLLKLVGKRVGACLRHHRGKGLLRSASARGSLLAWEITR
ncbi:MAG: hypothetical protein WDO17_01090 [Alphaproteobacteria bacterium]